MSERGISLDQTEQYFVIIIERINSEYDLNVFAIACLIYDAINARAVQTRPVLQSFGD